MSASRSRLRPLYIPQRKHADFEPPPDLKGGHLSPDLQPSTPPTFLDENNEASCQKAAKIGHYLLLEQLDVSGNVNIHRAFHCETQEEFVCKVIAIDKYHEVLSAYWQAGHHDNINEIREVLLGDTCAYVFFRGHHGDLHSYVRSKRKLREAEAMHLFQQIAAAVSHCHDNGVVLRDLKLRKFVFKDVEKTQLKLEGLEDACVLDDDSDDALADKHGCPAYVSPEILNTTHVYSGKAADIWSIGVMLYTMLIGRYPFHDVEPSALFGKIRRGQYNIPDSISSRAKCLIRCLLRHDPVERLASPDVLEHPWFRPNSLGGVSHKHSKNDTRDSDQMVPDFEGTPVKEDFFSLSLN